MYVLAYVCRICVYSVPGFGPGSVLMKACLSVRYAHEGLEEAVVPFSLVHLSDVCYLEARMNSNHLKS